MKLLQKLVTASVLSVAIGGATSGAALASDASELGNPGMLLYSNGTMVEVKPDSRIHRMIMRHAKPYRGRMLYSHGHHLYTIKNARMSDGRMLYDMLSPRNVGKK